MSVEERIKDFRMRAKFDPSSLHDLEGDSYLLVNPTSDDEVTLAELGLMASDCIKVDVYWAKDNDVCFVQLQTLVYAHQRDVGYYARRARSGYLNFVVVLDEKAISLETVERELTKLRSFKSINIQALTESLQSI